MSADGEASGGRLAKADQVGALPKRFPQVRLGVSVARGELLPCRIHSDSDWAGDRATGKSPSGGTVML